MLPEKTLAWGCTRSCIRELFEYGTARKKEIGAENVFRELFEYGTARKKEIGAENVFDFSLGNPSIPAPDVVNDSIRELIDTCDSITLHGYTTAAGLPSLREKIADDINGRFGLHVRPDRIYVTCGAAAALCISLRAILVPGAGEEVVVPAPYFAEYSVFIEAQGGKPVIVASGEGMQLDIEGIRAAINENTKAVLINSPNNPSGAIFKKENLMALADLLRDKEKEYGKVIYLITDEPYREIVFEGSEFTEPLSLYNDSIMCYSFSKALSIPGERLGYIALNGELEGADEVYFSILGAGRCLGYVNPPSLFQRVIEKSIGQTSDMSKYQENKDVLTKGLSEIGYEFVNPDGAFYLFVKALEPDAVAFSERAKKHELLLVPSNDFGVTGYFRICYAVSKEMIERSMPAFKALYEEYAK